MRSVFDESAQLFCYLLLHNTRQRSKLYRLYWYPVQLVQLGDHIDIAGLHELDAHLEIHDDLGKILG